MGGVVSTIGSWIKAGWDLAVKGLKWIWECISSLFGKVTNLLREVMSWVNYTREREWIQCGTTRLEVGLLSLNLVNSFSPFLQFGQEKIR